MQRGGRFSSIMKRQLTILAAIGAAFVIQNSAFASHVAGHPAGATQAHGGAVAANTAAENTNDSSMAWRVARYPGRVGMTVLRTPLIIGQTFNGKRDFISDRGLFQMSDDSDLRNSRPTGRGQRTAR